MNQLTIQCNALFLTKKELDKLRKLLKKYRTEHMILLVRDTEGIETQKCIGLIRCALKGVCGIEVLSDDDRSYDEIYEGITQWSEDVVFSLPKEAMRYAVEEEIMLDELARLFVKPKRWIHVQSMTRLTLQLAKQHGVDLHSARIAGLFHDCTKKIHGEPAVKLMKQCAKEHLQKPEAVWHQYTGAYWMEHVLQIDNTQAVEAVRHHVYGDLEEPLAMMVYIADKLDPSRGYDSSQTIALCMDDLRAGFAEVHRQQDSYLKETGVLG